MCLWRARRPACLRLQSPSTARLDRALKLPAYARAQIRHAWLINPTDQTIEVLALDQAGWRVVLAAGGSDRVRLPPFDAIELELQVLWDSRPAPAP